MQKFLFLASTLLLSANASFSQQNINQIINKSYVEKLLNTLASDEMGGRHALTPHIAKAADYIAEEFRQIGLQPYSQTADYRQSFQMFKINREKATIIWEQNSIPSESFLIVGNNANLTWNEKSNIKVDYIKIGDDFSSKFADAIQSQENTIILVDPSFASYIKRYNKIYSRENVVGENQIEKTASKVFIVADRIASNFSISCTNKIEKLDLFNVAGVIPGKSKSNEYVIFSAHYDHIGTLKPTEQDSIANGADDDASGTSAMISLAKYYKQLNNNERTLIFVAFTAEEIGMYGSKYFSNNINPDSVIAMINIEMIGKDSKFGPKTMYITGYNHSDLGKLMQENLKNTPFQFHPDPYPRQNLFYRSDNAVLAALGVPVHTFSTSQIDKDTYYHTVKDEVSTLDIENIMSSIEAIALGAEGLVKGIQTPSRVEKLRD